MAPKPTRTAVECTSTRTQDRAFSIFGIYFLRVGFVVENDQNCGKNATSGNIPSRLVPALRRHSHGQRHCRPICPNRTPHEHCRSGCAVYCCNDVRHRWRLYLADHIAKIGAEEQSHHHCLYCPNGSYPHLRSHGLPSVHKGLGSWGTATSVGDISSRRHTW